MVLAVNLGESSTQVGQFIREMGYTFPIAMDTQGAVGGLYGIRSIPTNFLIDRQGVVKYGRPGAFPSEETLLSFLQLIM